MKSCSACMYVRKNKHSSSSSSSTKAAEPAAPLAPAVGSFGARVGVRVKGRYISIIMVLAAKDSSAGSESYTRNELQNKRHTRVSLRCLGRLGFVRSVVRDRVRIRVATAAVCLFILDVLLWAGNRGPQVSSERQTNFVLDRGTS